MVRVLFVCMGNICRSPTAEGVFADLLRREGLIEHIHVDSAGTHAYHTGSAPDPRAQAAALRRGIDLRTQRARQVSDDDFERFDYILAMDHENLALLHDKCPEQFAHKLGLLLGYAPHLGIEEVPDPYYGGSAGFERVLDMVQEASEALLRDIRARHPAG
ncbi:MAG: low molecular weight phosphotyrosine protein phosphatase [Gammaproteobacteria bacterium]|nr:low molecular weight phosphotyrosine protein phosphatase [Gammaproteobacteria bacterium]